MAPGLFSAFGAFLMRQFFLGIPDELEEAARLDGANQFQVFWRVMLPLAVPGMSSLIVIGVLASWNDLLWPLIAISDQDHFTLIYDLGFEGGAVAHTGCVAFGIERITLALFRAHGMDVSSWPREVGAELFR